MSCKLPICCILIYFLSLTVSAQNVIRVAPNGISDGSTWAKASSIQQAIANAGSGDELRLKQGTYVISETLEVIFPLKIYGGYSGIGNQRNPENYQSILSGNNKVSILEATTRSSDVLLDGLYFENGLARSESEIGDQLEGGGLSLRGNRSVVSNCVFRNNNSRNSMGSGAIFIWADDVLVENCIFEGNSVVQNKTEYGNIGGGAIQLRFGDSNEIRNCIFKDNYSFYAGGAIFSFADIPKIIDCVFENNTSDGRGGAIFLNNNELTISNSIFKDNYSKISGGGVNANNGDLWMSNVIFENNEAKQHGGGFYNNFGNSKITNALFNKNQAVEGGGIYNAELLELSNVNFISNQHTALVLTNFGSTKIYNSIFYNNTPHKSYPNANADIDVGEYHSYPQLDALEIKRNILQNNPKGGTLAGNKIGVDPLFVNLATGNYALQHKSPAIDSGAKSLYNIVSSANAASTRDLGGNNRLFGDNIDLGAYEYNTPIVCTTLSLPIDGAINVPTATNIEWDAVPQATGYRISIGTTANGTELADNLDVGNATSFTPSTELLEDTTIYVRITPYNPAGEALGCTEENFTTETKLTAPDCTTLSLPINGAINVPTATNIEWDAVPQATGYRISIGTTANGTELADNLDVGNATSFTPSTELLEDTTIYVRITPYNPAGEALGCTEEHFTTETKLTTPDCTTLSLPINGAINVPTATNIEWDAVPQATGYRISIGTTANGTELADNLDVGNATSFTPSTELLEDTTIYVRITPYNPAGEALGCTEEHFTTETKLTTPDCTTLSLPINGAINVPTATNIEWDAVPQATGYRISIGTTANGTELADNLDVGNATSFTPSTELLEDTTIYVRITPYNPAGEALGCTEEHFTTETKLTAPDCTTLSLPINGAINVPTATNIEWDAVPQATGYRISIGTTANGTELADNLDVGNATSFTPSTELLEDTTIYVRITPYNPAGEALGCTEEHFTTETKLTTPDCTTLSLPINGAINVPTATNIEWDAVPQATGYRISIGTTANGTELADNLDVGNATSFTPSTELLEDTTIYVRITPYNPAGEALGCTEENFSTVRSLFVGQTKYGISPNGDGRNDFWEIPGIEHYRDNVVTIYNRWGDMVFQMEGYDNKAIVFDGNANKNTSIGGGVLPDGTYFFEIQVNSNMGSKTEKGFLVIKR